jgi:pepF/M3 family oligoendopeptidase
MNTMTTLAAMPRWDLSPFFPGPDSPDYARAFENVKAQMGGIGSLLTQAEAGTNTAAADFEALAGAFNRMREDARLMQAYLYALITTDSYDEVAQAKSSEFDALGSEMQKLGTRFSAWVGTQDVEGLIRNSPIAEQHAFWLRKNKEVAEHLMGPAEEALAAELGPSAGTAWGKLHGNMTSQLMVKVVLPDGEKQIPMSGVRNLAYDPDREVRRSAYAAELRAWKDVEVPMAACMNGIKGQVRVLTQRRKWESPLANSLFYANIDRQTLDAMLTAARESFPDFRRYLRAKAKLLGAQKLAWYDIFAPVGTEETWPWDQAETFVVDQFNSYSPKLGDFAARSFRERWTDAEPRQGKRDGAYCSGFRGDESRILMNYKPSFGSVMTLAHELGHAYHNVCLASRTPMQKETPMTLAETASIFCETIIKRSYLETVEPTKALGTLEATLQGYCQVVVDITSRFEFEQDVFEKRADRDLSGSEFCNLMLKAQKNTYGDGLDMELLHPYMWSVKPHYYSAGRSFYNYPYMFGCLFGLGLYSRYKADPEGFKAVYDDLLSSTGLADAATLAAGFGFDIRTPEFWRGSLRVIVDDIDRFEAITGG